MRYQEISKTGIYLQSDFIDYYDDCLHDPTATKVFKRLTKCGMIKREALSFLDKNGFKTVPHGTVKELVEKYLEESNCDEMRRCDERWKKDYDIVDCNYSYKLVVYLDETSHCGEGKILVDQSIAYKNYPNHYASIRLLGTDYFQLSFRCLYIGDKSYLLAYQSFTDEWRSNVGDVKTVLIGRKDGSIFKNKKRFNFPLYALDYIKIPVGRDYYFPDGLREEEFYVDLNISPAMPKDCGFEDVLPPEEAAKEICEYMDKQLTLT